MDLELIKNLMELFEEKGLTELEIKEKDFRIRMSRGELESRLPAGSTEYMKSTPPASKRETEGKVTEGKEDVVKREESSDIEEDTGDLVTVYSPIVGTFYRSPAPGERPFVEESDYVRKGQVLCIIEAMKLMNEIESEYEGTIHSILVENSQPVEYGEPLFLIKAAS